MQKKVAFFDIDGTIFRSSLLIELTETLIELGFFDKKARNGYSKPFKKWVDRTGSYEDYIGAVVKVFMKFIKGVSYLDFKKAADLTVARSKNKLYRFTRDLIKDLKKENYFIVAISQSPKSILDNFCKRLGFDKVYGRIYELGPSDRFTGAVVDEHLIINKANIVRRVIEKENLTLQNSYGVGDTESDIPLLEMVETAICFNPNAALYKHAKRMGWRIVVERKDVIYKIN